MSKPPSWNEIRTNATAFATRWADATDENAEAQSFWNEFLGVFGIDRKRVGTFEARAKRTSTGGRGRIDLFWPGTLVAEHKSAGKDLAYAEEQALDYLDSIDVDNFPGVIITSDFANLRIRDLGGDNEPFTFPLSKLPEEIDRFGFIAGYQKRKFGDAAEVEANIQAAKLMGGLYEELARSGYEGHDASVLMTRLLFLMFGDDTGMWEKGLFAEYIETRTNPDGSDLGAQLALLFQVLDRAEDKRQATLDELLLRFPYVNGHLFSDRIDIPAFDRPMRDELVRCANFDWSKISPAVFGSLFQAVKSREARRSLGEHYTTEHNILRALAPLFLDELWEEFEASKQSKQKLERLHDKVAGLKIMDPACGCGNFLVIAYRELRRIELAILVRIQELSGDGQLVLDVGDMVRVKLSNFYGIEIEDWPAKIAATAMFLVDQQANHELARQFGQAPDRLPIMQAANITIGNALRMEWNEVLPNNECSFVVGNPPFIGKKIRTAEQQEDMASAFAGWGNIGNLDYVAAWYVKAAAYMQNTSIVTALVSTSSLCQGEQVELLWPRLMSEGIRIIFAHRPFKWTSEASGAAAVSVVIVGFTRSGKPNARPVLFDYPDETSEPVSQEVAVIGPYLTDGSTVVVTKRKQPLVPVPPMAFGSMPNDGGLLFVTEDEVASLKETDPGASSLIRRFFGAQELIDDSKRFCIWSVGADPAVVSKSKFLTDRATRVREYRAASTRAATRQLADFPLRFGEVRQPTTRFLAVPCHSSENRIYLPCRFLDPENIASNALMTIAGANEYLFGILSSRMFMAWLAEIGGKLESRLRVSAEIVYNNFPFPEVDEAARAKVATAASEVLRVRDTFEGASLFDLYNPAAMPEELVKAHQSLDKHVDALFSKSALPTVGARLAVLLDRYSELTTAYQMFPADPPPKKTRKKKSE